MPGPSTANERVTAQALDWNICSRGAVMTDWIVESTSAPRGFPRVRHRHANGTLEAVRDRTPTVVRTLDGPAMERWAYLCACGEVYTLERER
jgi:hypothetical protein